MDQSTTTTAGATGARLKASLGAAMRRASKNEAALKRARRERDELKQLVARLRAQISALQSASSDSTTVASIVAVSGGGEKNETDTTLRSMLEGDNTRTPRKTAVQELVAQEYCARIAELEALLARMTGRLDRWHKGKSPAARYHSRLRGMQSPHPASPSPDPWLSCPCCS